MGKRVGIVHILVNGKLLESLPGASIDVGGAVRTPVVGSSRVLGYTEAIKQAEVECEVAVGAGTSLRELSQIAGATLTFRCDTGQVYNVAEACLQEPPKLTAGEGKAGLKFFGQPADEVAG